MSKSSIWPIGSALLSGTTPGQSEPGSNGNERASHISQSLRAGASPIDGLLSYPEHLLWGGVTVQQKFG